MMLDLFIVLLTIVWFVIVSITFVNVIAFPRLSPSARPSRRAAEGEVTNEWTFVSICIPARDEAQVIGDTIRLLLAQDHPAFEIVVLDDGSTDNTSAIALLAAEGDPRLRIVSGRPLPKGWLGKNWACQQLSTEAKGRLLVFTDADVRWGPGALSAAVALMVRTRADLLTVWPTQTTVTWGERLIVPLIAFVIFAYLPIPLVHGTRYAALAAANGQCLLFRRRAYDRVGGHMTVRASIVEDIAFAREIKRRRLRLRMADGAGMIGCRMYDGWRGVRDGFAKNIIAGYGGLIPFLLGVLFHWAILFGPWAVVAAGAPLAGGLLVGAGISVRALTAAATRQRVGDALLMPISALAMTAIAVRALAWALGGGPRWKGRALRT